MESKTLGQRIRDLRIRKGMTQIELGSGICTPSMISQIESDRAKPSYSILTRIANKLDTSLEHFLADVEMNLQTQSTYKMARQMVAAKEYETAIPLLLQLLELPKPLFATTDVLLLLSECYLFTGRLELSEKHLEQLKSTYISLQDLEMLAVVLKQLGIMETTKKQYEVAVYHFEAALEELEKVDHADAFLKAEILLHLGRVREKQGKIKQAIELFDAAKELYEGKSTTEEMANLYAELSRTHQRLHDVEMSIDYSDRAFALYQLVDNQYMSIKVEMTAAIAYGQSGREEEAIYILESAIVKLQALKKTEDVGIAYTELAKMQLALDDVQGGEKSCAIARSLLPELHLYQAWVSRIQGNLAIKENKFAEAMRFLQRAAECFKMLGEISLWAETMAELSQLKIQENDLNSAVNILEAIRLETKNELLERGIVL